MRERLELYSFKIKTESGSHYFTVQNTLDLKLRTYPVGNVQRCRPHSPLAAFASSLAQHCCSDGHGETAPASCAEYNGKQVKIQRARAGGGCT